MINVAILGGGFMGQTHAGAWSALAGRARVVAVSSRSHERAARAAALCGAEATDDLYGPLERGDVDVADICLPTPQHREAAERAFAAGKHVLLEKPIALTLEDADAIVAAGERAGKLLVVGLVLRFWPEYVELRRIAASGELGRPLAASALRLSPPPGWNDWMIDPARSGGVCVDLMVHDFDAVSAVLGLPRRVFARALRSGPHGAPQHCVAVVEHESGEAAAEGGLMQPDSYPFSSNLRVLCEGGVVEYPFTAAPAADGGNIGGVDQAANRLRVHPAGGPMRLVEVASADPWAGQTAAVATWLERGEAPTEATGPQATVALRVALAANRSLESGRVEDVWAI
jgi:predicted dehydrogenase